jgi:hypothetical protein
VFAFPSDRSLSSCFLAERETKVSMVVVVVVVSFCVRSLARLPLMDGRKHVSRERRAREQRVRSTHPRPSNHLLTCTYLTTHHIIPPRSFPSTEGKHGTPISTVSADFATFRVTVSRAVECCSTVVHSCASSSSVDSQCRSVTRSFAQAAGKQAYIIGCLRLSQWDGR